MSQKSYIYNPLVKEPLTMCRREQYLRLTRAVNFDDIDNFDLDAFERYEAEARRTQDPTMLRHVARVYVQLGSKVTVIVPEGTQKHHMPVEHYMRTRYAPGCVFPGGTMMKIEGIILPVPLIPVETINLAELWFETQLEVLRVGKTYLDKYTENNDLVDKFLKESSGLQEWFANPQQTGTRAHFWHLYACRYIRYQEYDQLATLYNQGVLSENERKLPAIETRCKKTFASVYDDAKKRKQYMLNKCLLALTRERNEAHRAYRNSPKKNAATLHRVKRQRAFLISTFKEKDDFETAAERIFVLKYWLAV